MRRTKLIKVLLLICSFTLLGIGAWAYYPMITSKHLTFKWEGLLSRNLNFRDAGVSINQCIGREVLPEGQLFRSSRFFSGWSCDEVGSPDEIFSLDTFPQDGRKFYCRSDDGFKIGRSFQTSELRDLEFEETWNNHPEFVTAACQNIAGILKGLKAGKKILVHCDAGRDRTGAVTALLAAYIAEEHSELNDVIISGLECDYRKSRSLKPYKYGRIEVFLHGVIKNHGSVHAFLASECGDKIAF